MRTKLLAVGSTLLLVAGLISVGAGPASAHANAVTGDVTCNSDYQWVVTWSIANDFELSETITESSDKTVVPLGTVIESLGTSAFTQTVSEAKKLTLKVTGTWSDNYSQQDTGIVEKAAFNGVCAPETPKVDICHATNSDTNPYTYINVSKNSARYEGHLSHRNAPNKIWKTDTVFNGVLHLAGSPKADLIDGMDGDISEALCSEPGTPPIKVINDAQATVDLVGASCEAPGSVTKGAIEHASWNGDIVLTDGHYTVSATADAGHTFAKGETTVTLTGDVAGQLPSQGTDPEGDCYIAPPPTQVRPTASISVQCGTATVTFTNGTQYAFAGDVRVDNEPYSVADMYGLGPFYQIVNIPADGATKTINFAEDSGTHTVAYRIGLGAERDWYVGWQTAEVTSDCLPPVVTVITAVKPDVSKADVCGAWDDSLVVTSEQEGIDYEVKWNKHHTVATVIATAADGYVLANNRTQKVWKFHFTNEPCPIVVKPVKPDVSVSDVCGVSDDSLVVTSEQEGVDYEVTWNKAHTKATVVASAADGYVFGEIAKHAWKFQFTNDPCPTDVTPGDPRAVDQTCVDGELTSGSVWVDLEEGVAYTINGTPVAQAVTTVEPGTYTVRATALEGYVLSGDTVWPYAVTVNAAKDCVEPSDTPADPPTLGLLTPQVTWSNLDCKGNGWYTLADIEGVLWSVEGNPVKAGTYPVDSATTVHITAAADAPEHGLESDAQTEWTLEFTAAKDCPQLKTLALPNTGVDGNGINLGLLFSSSLVLLGGALLYAERRLRFGRN